jgi:putative PIN family toxin of toxin-antitoxin system
MAKSKRLKIVLDTNWYISASINRNSRRRLYELLVNDRLIIYYSKELLDEYKDVIFRKKFEKYIRKEQIVRFINLILTRLKPIEIKTLVRLSRDEKDNFLLSMAIDSSADYLVSGDPDLLEIKSIGKTKIIDMSTFLKRIE